MQESEHTENENDGRSVMIDSGHYKVQVWGDVDDSFDEVVDKAKDVADKAKSDAMEMDERYDNGDSNCYK